MGVTSSQVYISKDSNTKLTIYFAATLLELFISNSHLSAEQSSQDGQFISHHDSQKKSVMESSKRLGYESQRTVSRA